jgi:hypothetical protein
MSITQVVVLYGIVFFVLLLALLISLCWGKVNWQNCLRYFDWRKIVVAKQQIAVGGQFWLKILLAAFIALCSGVALITLILPYGSGWVLVALSATLLVLALLLPYLLA